MWEEGGAHSLRSSIRTLRVRWTRYTISRMVAEQVNSCKEVDALHINVGGWQPPRITNTHQSELQGSGKSSLSARLHWTARRSAVIT